MFVIHDYTLIYNLAYAVKSFKLSYEDVRTFSNILFNKLMEKNIPFIYKESTEFLTEYNGYNFLKRDNEIKLLNGYSEKLIECINFSYTDDIKKIISDSMNEYTETILNVRKRS